MNIKSKNNTSTTVDNTINQNQLVIGYLKRNSRRNLTSEQICEAINISFKEKKIKTKLTVQQISKCLNRFTEKKMVQKVDQKGKFSSGRKATRWTYVAHKS